MWYFIQQALKIDKVKLMRFMGMYNGWGSFLLKYGGEVFLVKFLIYLLTPWCRVLLEKLTGL